MIHRRHALALMGAALALPAAAPVWADQPMIHARSGLAIGGYDPVAYFTQGKPVKGKSAHKVMWKGAVWTFASAAHREAFEADPRRYAPQFGGYCAYAVSRGYTAKTDPKAWKVHEGRLYLNYSTQVRTLWSRDIPGNIALARGNWPGVLSK